MAATKADRSCTGGFLCPAATHVHGCFADRHGNCDAPHEHVDFKGRPLDRDGWPARWSDPSYLGDGPYGP